MTDERDVSAGLQAQVLAAAEDGTPLNITGGNSKTFIGREPTGTMLDVSRHTGVLSYEPTELVVTVRGGTLLSELEKTLEAAGQMLAFEPPHFSDNATIGGTLACGLSGARRAYAGAARDFTLGVKILNGKGECLSFGGQVMKNVAGYDLSRLMVGSMGTLGVLLEVSLKVLPRPIEERTLAFEMDAKTAVARMNQLAGTALPISAAAFAENQLHVRVSGTNLGVGAACQRLGGEPSGADLWTAVGEQTHASFSGDGTLWRVSLPSTTAHDATEPACVIDWGGALRWVRSTSEATRMRAQIEKLAGHAWAFRVSDRRSDVFHPLPGPLLGLHKRLKAAFDPMGILNPGRMYAEI